MLFRLIKAIGVPEASFQLLMGSDPHHEVLNVLDSTLRLDVFDNICLGIHDVRVKAEEDEEIDEVLNLLLLSRNSDTQLYSSSHPPRQQDQTKARENKGLSSGNTIKSRSTHILLLPPYPCLHLSPSSHAIDDQCRSILHRQHFRLGGCLLILIFSLMRYDYHQQFLQPIQNHFHLHQ